MHMNVAVLTEEKGSGMENLKQFYTFLQWCSNYERGKEQKCAAVNKKTENYIINWELMDGRSLRTGMTTNQHKVMTLGIYDPSEDDNILTKEEFYEKRYDLSNEQCLGMRKLHQAL